MSIPDENDRQFPTGKRLISGDNIFIIGTAFTVLLHRLLLTKKTN
ncbi:MAG: hypothetical protein NY202_03055 [Mollicutes bacterium UO1]